MDKLVWICWKYGRTWLVLKKFILESISNKKNIEVSQERKNEENEFVYMQNDIFPNEYSGKK